jgi:GPH family glycoside/pentoside/hexuronide:cation symporter
MNNENSNIAAESAGKSFIERTSGLKMPEYIGYALGDVGCCLVFGMVTSLLQKFYTDIFQLPALWIMIMMVVTRIWDAINDPIMGYIADTSKPGKNGRYRRWMVWSGLPLALATILMFSKFPGIGDVPNHIPTLIYATFTYVLFDMAYTVAQIPYGSLANVITSSETERNKLSMFRSVGAGIGSLPVMIIASFCYRDRLDEMGNQIIGENQLPVEDMIYTPIIIGAIVMAIAMLGAYLLCYKMTKERIVISSPVKRQKGETKKIISILLKNRAFLSISIASMLLLAGQMFTQSYYLYLFSDYFGNGSLNLINTACTYLPMVIVLFLSAKLIKRFGKNELCAVGIVLSAVANLVLFACKGLMPQAAWLFMLLSFFNGVGQAFIILQVWSLIATAIDDVEVKSGIREDGTAYSSFMFFRKIGQMIAAVAVNGALIAMNYKTETGAVQTKETLEVMYDMATLIPAIIFFAMAIVLFFWNPLNKKAVEELQVLKEQKLKEKHDNNEIVIH